MIPRLSTVGLSSALGLGKAGLNTLRIYLLGVFICEFLLCLQTLRLSQLIFSYNVILHQPF